MKMFSLWSAAFALFLMAAAPAGAQVPVLGGVGSVSETTSPYVVLGTTTIETLSSGTGWAVGSMTYSRGIPYPNKTLVYSQTTDANGIYKLTLEYFYLLNGTGYWGKRHYIWHNGAYLWNPLAHSPGDNLTMPWDPQTSNPVKVNP